VADPVAWKLVEPGWAVVDRDGEQVGSVGELLGDPEADIFDGLTLSQGGILDRPKYVPSEQVGAIEEGTVHLTLDGTGVAGLGDHEPPPAGQRFLAR
jgi:uncharacterized protein YrrD